MRRLAAALIAPLAVTAALAGCSSSSTSSASANQSVTASGAVGQAPSVTIPAEHASADLVTKTLTQGHGYALTTSDSFLANFDVYLWRGTTHKLLYSTYSSAPQMLPVTMGLSGMQKAMTGVRLGSRVLAVLPPRYAYGASGQPQLGVQATDTLVWVVDPVQAFTPTTSASGQRVSDGGGTLPTVSGTAGSAPTLAFPKAAPPGKLVVTTLIKGAGPAVKPGQTLVTRYIGSIWRTGKEFNNDWPSAAQPAAPPTAFPLNNVIPAWRTGLVGIPVGSRVMLVVPPAEGYGKAGQASAGIKGTDTLVFVVDILAATG